MTSSFSQSPVNNTKGILKHKRTRIKTIKRKLSKNFLEIYKTDGRGNVSNLKNQQLVIPNAYSIITHNSKQVSKPKQTDSRKTEKQADQYYRKFLNDTNSWKGESNSSASIQKHFNNADSPITECR